MFVGPAGLCFRFNQHKVSGVVGLKRNQQVDVLLVARGHGFGVQMNALIVVLRKRKEEARVKPI